MGWEHFASRSVGALGLLLLLLLLLQSWVINSLLKRTWIVLNFLFTRVIYILHMKFKLYRTVCVNARSLQSCLTLGNPTNCSPPGSVHGILQARMLEWVAMPWGRGNRTQYCSSRNRNAARVSPGRPVPSVAEDRASSLICPFRHQFLGGGLSRGLQISNCTEPWVSDWHSGSAMSSEMRVAAWQAFPQIPGLPWVVWHLLALRSFGCFTVHLFKVFETLSAEQLRL